MGGALSIFVILSLSVFVVRVASVALRLTGLTDSTARFQALSAFSGTGFTTSEAETIVNYPVRRRIVSVLMVIGNLGLVTVLATLVTSLVRTDGEIGAVIAQLAWLAGGLALLWFLMLNRRADRMLCGLIGRILTSTTLLGSRRFHRLLQISDGYSICEHPAQPQLRRAHEAILDRAPTTAELTVLAVRTPSGGLTIGCPARDQLVEGATLVLFGRDTDHERLGGEPTPASPDADLTD